MRHRRSHITEFKSFYYAEKTTLMLVEQKVSLPAILFSFSEFDVRLFDLLQVICSTGEFCHVFAAISKLIVLCQKSN